MEPAAGAAKALNPTLHLRVGNLDTVRGIAATGVLASHVAYATGFVQLPFWGGLASRLVGFVNLFFILSGFVLFRPYALASAERGGWPGTGRYLVRRAFRILPAYWLLVIVAIGPAINGIREPGEWLRYLTLTQYYVPEPLLPGISVAWTLTVEVVFYALLPLAAFALLRQLRPAGSNGARYRPWRPQRVLLLVLASGLLVSIGWLSQVQPGRLNPIMHVMWFPTYAMCFAVGMALAVASVALGTGTAPRWWRVLDHIGRQAWACWGVAAVLFSLSVVVAGPLGGFGLPWARDLVIRELLYLGFSTFLLLPVIFGRAGAWGGWTALNRLLALPPLRYVGTVSYGLFLWHLTALETIRALHPDLVGLGTVRLFLLTLAGGLVLATVSWYAVERPAQRLGNTLLARLRRRSTAQAPAQPQPQPVKP